MTIEIVQYPIAEYFETVVDSKLPIKGTKKMKPVRSS